MNNYTFGRTKSTIWLEKYSGFQKGKVAEILSSMNEATNFLRLLHESANNNSLVTPYRHHVNRLIQEEYNFWKIVVREELTDRVSDVALSVVRQRFNNFFFKVNQ